MSEHPTHDAECPVNPCGCEAMVCKCCGYEFETIESLSMYRLPGLRNPNNDQWQALCNICASTFIGNAHNYPSQYENEWLGKALAYVANEILQTLRKQS